MYIKSISQENATGGIDLINEKLNETLRRIRKTCGLSQQQIANGLNVDRATYAYYESGRTQPSLESLSKIAEIFNVSLYELLEDEDSGSQKLAFHNDGMHSDERSKDTLTMGMLTKEERDLIVRFRMLSPHQRSELLEVMGVPPANKASDKK